MSKRQEAKESRLSAGLLIGILVTIFFAVALVLRVCLPYDKIFVGDWIKYAGADCYYHIRFVDDLVHNFPHLSKFDPYFIYPGGTGVAGFHFFDRLLASITWTIGLGSPTQHTIDVVGVYFPTVLGALTVIPVYFIGRELFGRWAGVLSAGLIALLPGEFLGRSILGFTDHHAAEVLFSTIAILLLILAIKAAIQRQLTPSQIKHRDWATIRRPVIYSLLAGFFLGLYLLTFVGGPLFVFIITVYLVIQFIIDHLRHKFTDYLCLVGVTTFFMASVVSLPFTTAKINLVSLPIALVIPLVLSVISRLMASKQIKPAYYPLALVGVGLAGLGIFYLINPSLLRSMLSLFSVFFPTGTQLTTIEMQPLISAIYRNPFAVAWGNFTTGFFFSLISLGILIYLIVKQGSPEKTLLVVWSLLILATTLGQRRFCYYYAVNVALLTGYLSWEFLRFAGFKETGTKAVKLLKGVRQGKARPKKGGFKITARQVNMTLAVLITLLAVFAPFILFPTPNESPTIATASIVRYAPTDGWISSLYWMRENTPDPFDNPDFYYEPHETPPPNVAYDYPESAYGVLSWWDYGYWITRIAHRIPNANPSQDPIAINKVASFFISQDENPASEIAQELDSSYIIVDDEMTYGKFWAIASWADKSPADYFDFYYVLQENQQLTQVQFLYPEYYRTLAARLYNFDGKAVSPENVLVISYQENTDKAGNTYKILTGAEQFNTYEEAEAYRSSQESDNYRIVSTSPMLSPVPLEALEHYQLIYSSNTTITMSGVAGVPEVKIFEYID